MGGRAVSTELTILVMKYQFDTNAGLMLLAMIFAFIFSLLGVK